VAPSSLADPFSSLRLRNKPGFLLLCGLIPQRKKVKAQKARNLDCYLELVLDEFRDLYLNGRIVQSLRPRKARSSPNSSRASLLGCLREQNGPFKELPSVCYRRHSGFSSSFSSNGSPCLQRRVRSMPPSRRTSPRRFENDISRDLSVRPPVSAFSCFFSLNLALFSDFSLLTIHFGQGSPRSPVLILMHADLLRELMRKTLKLGWHLQQAAYGRRIPPTPPTRMGRRGSTFSPSVCLIGTGRCC
jgi:hypothetical protein